MAALKFYFDSMSQPCRSLMIFLRCTNMEHDPKLIDVAKGKHLTDEYKVINPTAKVPAIDDDGFTLFESTAILQYLCNTRNVADHWYPKDLQKRAKINEYLSWHHTNLRMGAAMTFRTTTLIPLLTGQPPKDASKFIKILDVSLDTLENYFLSKTDFISGNDISVADLMAVTELSQLEVMGKTAPELPTKVSEWKERCIKQTAPHYHDVHKVMYKVRDMVAARSKL